MERAIEQLDLCNGIGGIKRTMGPRLKKPTNPPRSSGTVISPHTPIPEKSDGMNLKFYGVFVPNAIVLAHPPA